MKGKQLSLEEVLNLEDGSKVWVEELDEEYRDSSQVYTINKEEKRLYTKRDEFYRFDYSFEDNSIEFYEWIEDELVIPDQIEEPYYSQSVVESMANEIARHRYPNKYEYDDELIDMIIKEFS